MSLRHAATQDPCGMSEPDTDERWLPIQIAPDECDLELGRPHKAGLCPGRFRAGAGPASGTIIWAGEAVLISPSHWRIWRFHR